MVVTYDELKELIAKNRVCIISKSDEGELRTYLWQLISENTVFITKNPRFRNEPFRHLNNSRIEVYDSEENNIERILRSINFNEIDKVIIDSSVFEEIKSLVLLRRFDRLSQIATELKTCGKKIIIGNKSLKEDWILPSDKHIPISFIYCSELIVNLDNLEVIKCFQK